MAGQANKVRYGLKNVHYAVVTEEGTTVTYGTPKSLIGAIELVLKPKGERVEFYADDTLYYNEEMNQGYEGELGLALIPDDFKVEVLGFVRDENGVLFENTNAKTKKIALLYEFDGDKNKTRRVLYSVVVGRTDAGSKTKGEKNEIQSETMNISVSPALDTGDVQAKVEQDQLPYESWFKSVYKFIEPQTATP